MDAVYREVVEEYGIEIGHYPAKLEGMFLSNIDVGIDDVFGLKAKVKGEITTEEPSWAWFDKMVDNVLGRQAEQGYRYTSSRYKHRS